LGMWCRRCDSNTRSDIPTYKVGAMGRYATPAMFGSTD
jgi:hypothetical protein